MVLITTFLPHFTLSANNATAKIYVKNLKFDLKEAVREDIVKTI